MQLLIETLNFYQSYFNKLAEKEEKEEKKRIKEVEKQIILKKAVDIENKKEQIRCKYMSDDFSKFKIPLDVLKNIILPYLRYKFFFTHLFLPKYYFY